MRKPRLILLLLTLILSACVPIVRPEQPNQTDTFVFKPGGRIGQTMVANFAGMNGIEVYLAPKGGAQGQITLHLREDAEADSDLGVAALPAESVTTAGFYRFPLPPQAASRQRYYYFEMRFEGQGALQVGRAPGEAYLDGAAYREGEPVDSAQLAFLLDYDPLHMALGLAGEALTWMWYLLLAAFLFVLPGWVLLAPYPIPSPEGGGEISSPHTPAEGEMGLSERQAQKTGAPSPHTPAEGEMGLSGRQAQKTGAPSPHTHLPKGDGLAMRNLWVRVVLSAGVGLALYPILLLWTHLFGLHLGRWYAVLPAVAALGWITIRGRRTSVYVPSSIVRGLWSPANITLLIVLALLVFSRFWVIRTLEGPMWGDGMQHTMVTQLLLDHGGLFDSWRPYADIPTFTYHFGFHTASALFAWLTGLEARFAVLWMGQILNILAVLALYPLAWKIGGENPWAGTGAVLVAGLLSPMPGFYLNWGRYTQLVGQVILPVALYFTWAWLERGAPLRWRDLTLGAILWAGLGLTHYRVLIMGVLGLLAYLLLRWRAWRDWLPGLAVLGAMGGVLFAPWFVHVFGGQILHLLQAQLHQAPEKLSAFTESYNSVGRLDLYLPYPLWLMLFLGAGVTLWQRQHWGAAVTLWMFFLFVLANPAWLHLPGSGAVNNFAVFILAYAFAGLFIGVLPTTALRKTPGVPGAALFLALALYGLPQRVSEIRPSVHAMSTRPDVRAGAWMQAYTPPDSKVYINAFPAFVTAHVGADGGWWLAMSAGRQPLIRPLNAGFETPVLAAQREQIARLYDLLQVQGTVDTPEALTLLAQNDLRYVYIGQQQGRVNYGGPVLHAEIFQRSPAYRAVYHQDRVWIFEVVGKP
ncbi:MAG: hypothetical protein Fur0018_22060 [Anaerolineales bacterium]